MITVTFRFLTDPPGVTRSVQALTDSAAAAERIARSCIAGEIEILSVAGASGPAFDARFRTACEAYEAAAAHPKTAA